MPLQYQSGMKMEDVLEAVAQKSVTAHSIPDSHIIDDDRCLNAQRLEEAFYSGKKALSVNSESSDPEQAVSPGMAEEAADTNTNDETSADAALLMKLLQKPEMAALLKMLAASL